MSIRIISIVALATLVLDQVTKWVVVQVYDLAVVGRLEVWPPFLNLRMAWNTGVNFGIGGSADLRWFLIGLSVAISVGLVWWAVRRGSVALAWGVGLVVGGAIGNAIDRVIYGAVADFLNTSCCGFENPYSFNVADIAIFAGALWIVWKA